MIAAAATLLTYLGISDGRAKKVAPWALALAVAILAGLAVASWLHFHDRAVVRTDRLEGNVTQLEGQVMADAAAADQRLVDQSAQSEQEQAYANAINAPVAGDAADPGQRLACERLRRDGQDTTAIPACGRH